MDEGMASARTKTIRWALGAFAVGLVPAFFVALNIVFSDVFGIVERLLSLAYAFAAYLVFGAAFGLPRAPDARWVALGLVLPAAFALAWYSAHEPGAVGLHALVALVSAAGAAAGALSVHWLRTRRAAAAPA